MVQVFYIAIPNSLRVAEIEKITAFWLARDQLFILFSSK